MTKRKMHYGVIQFGWSLNEGSLNREVLRIMFMVDSIIFFIHDEVKDILSISICIALCNSSRTDMKESLVIGILTISNL